MNKKYTIEKRCDESDSNPLDILKPSFFVEHTGKRLTFYLSGEITEPQDYVDWFHLIRNACENDLIIININSNGGDLATAIQFMSVLEDCDAKVLITVEGNCMSAATLIFLSGDAFTLSPYSLFMFHNYSSGCFGKGGEMHDRISFEHDWSKNLFTTAYKNFLTTTEIQSLLDGKDFWLTAQEVMERMNKKLELDEKEFNKKMKELELSNKPQKEKKITEPPKKVKK